MPIELCPHKMNPIACPTCFRTKQAQPKPKAANPDIRPGVPMGQTVSMEQAIASASRAAAKTRGAPTVAVASGPVMKDPHSSGNAAPPPEAHDPNKVWEPPARASIIDKQPRHPYADQSKVSVLKR